MYDPWVTREVTLRDLVTHRAGLGLGQGDLMWWPATEFTRREIVRGIRHLKPVSSLRSRYAYSNVMYVAAGEVVAQVSGRSWDEFLRERIFAPLGMSRTSTSVAASAPNLATPHLMLKGRPSPVAPMHADNCGAAGAINSSASDMARWLQMLLECGRRGASGGKGCVLKPDSIRRLWSAQIALGTPEPPSGLEALRANFVAYGLGFGLRDYRGRKLVSSLVSLFDTPDLATDLACGLRPPEGFGIRVPVRQEASDPSLERAHALEAASPDGLCRQQCEPPLHQIEP
jgi:CubicO group peptidase (beta-lactamase class C family)